MTMDFNPRPINSNHVRVVGTAPRFDSEKDMKEALRSIFGGNIPGPTSSPSSSHFTSNQNWNGNDNENTDGAHYQGMSPTLFNSSTLRQFYPWRNDPMQEASASLPQSAMMLPQLVPASSSSSSSSLAAQAWPSSNER
jgi:hypothetical protein